MICRLCVSTINNSDFILIFDNNGSEFGVAKVVAKYISLELTANDAVSDRICCKCWCHLENFHKFCLLIEEKQRDLEQRCKKERRSEDEAPTASGFKDFLAGEDSQTEHKDFLPIENNDSRSADSSLDGKDINVSIIGNHHINAKNTLQTDIFIKNEALSSKKHIEKRKRGRPKKGDEKPKGSTKKPKSEKHFEYYRISREFDEIISKHMKLNCNICTNLLNNFGDLKRHFRTVHKCRGYAVCCNKRLYKKSLVVDHINTHINPEYFKCTQCNKVLSDRMCLRNHILSLHQTDQDKIYQCKDCPKKFAKQYLLDHHKVMHVPESERNFVCDSCGKGFPTKSTLNMHVNLLHTNAYSKMCEICAKVIRGKTAFKKHQLAHAGIFEPSVQCELCGSWLKDSNSLRKHMYRHKEDSKGGSNVCNICGKVAPSKTALSSHYRYVHTTERTHKCTLCEKAFKRPKALKEHMATHTGEMLYSCPHCPRAFKSSANMHSHRKKVHRIEWDEARVLRPVLSVPT